MAVKQNPKVTIGHVLRAYLAGRQDRIGRSAKLMTYGKLSLTSSDSNYAHSFSAAPALGMVRLPICLSHGIAWKCQMLVAIELKRCRNTESHRQT